MLCVHLVPVGTSLLGNFARSVEGSRVVSSYGLEGLERFAPDDPRQVRVCELWGELSGYLRGFIESTGELACAELSSLLRASRGLGCEPGSTRVILYSTNTCNARLAMSVIAWYLREKLGFIVEERVISSASSEDELDIAMAELVDTVLRDTVRYAERGYHVCVNATPGFKVESAYVTVAAMLAGIHCVYYMHEAFRDVVYMPVPPLQLRSEYVDAILALEKPIEVREAVEKLGKTMLEELKARGLVVESGGVVRARRWAVSLAKLARS